MPKSVVPTKVYSLWELAQNLLMYSFSICVHLLYLCSFIAAAFPQPQCAGMMWHLCAT